VKIVDRTDALSLNRQLSLLGVSKSSYYHSIAERPDPDAFLKHLVLLVYRERPHYGYWRIAVELAVKHDTHVGEGKVRGVMKALALRAIIRRRIVTTMSDPDNRVVPNLLSDLRLTRSIQSHCGKGRAADNGQLENLWYSLKHECLNHKELRTLPQLRKAVNRYFINYNGDRPHSSLGYRYPNAVYREGLAGAA